MSERDAFDCILASLREATPDSAMFGTIQLARHGQIVAIEHPARFLQRPPFERFATTPCNAEDRALCLSPKSVYRDRRRRAPEDGT